MGEEDSDGVGCNFRRGGIGDFDVVFLSFLVFMMMRKGLLLWDHFMIGCGLDALAEGCLGSLLPDLHRAYTHDGSMQERGHERGNMCLG